MTRKRLDMRLTEAERADIETVKMVHSVTMARFVRYAIARALEEIGIRKANYDDLLKKK